jgi:hypothetical protein
MIRRQWRERWFAIGATGLLAASIAAVSVRWWPHEQPPVVNAVPSLAADDVEQLVSWRATDEGVEVIDQHLPVRKLRQDAIQQIKWFDPQRQAHMQITVPVTRVILIEQQTY